MSNPRGQVGQVVKDTVLGEAVEVTPVTPAMMRVQ